MTNDTKTPDPTALDLLYRVALQNEWDDERRRELRELYEKAKSDFDEAQKMIRICEATFQLYDVSIHNLI